MTPVRSVLSLLAVGVASFALIACDSATADNETPAASSTPTATSTGGGSSDGGSAATPTGTMSPGVGDTPVTPGDTPPATGTPVDPGYPTEVVPAPIESVDVVVRESFPPQYAAVVVSGLPSGCAQFHGIEVERVGDTFNITVTNTMPAAGEQIACTMIYGMVEHSVTLEGEFVSGSEYTVIVNGEKETTFTAQ